MSERILLVDDEPAFQRLCGNWLASLGYTVNFAAHAEQAMAQWNEFQFDLVLLDLALPPSFRPEEGMALLPALNQVPVVVMTGHAERELALQAINLGAWDFLSKPLDPDLLQVVVQRALNKRRLERELQSWRERTSSHDETMGLLGQSQAMQELRTLVRRVAATDVPVLISGPSGTGKELVARAIHQHSSRATGPFVAVHCGAIPAELFESELFGYLKGAFTGADRDRPGLLAAAHGGTLFLDELGEMPLTMQVKLLRFLQQGSYYPVGGRSEERADCRVVSATHRDLGQMISQQTFRDDLYYRLKGIQLRTPALAERLEDVPLLARAAAVRMNPARTIEPTAMRWLQEHPWPGNVRELLQAVQTAGALAGGTDIRIDDLRLACGDAGAEDPPPTSLDEQLGRLEKRLLLEALELHRRNHTHAARQLGISRVGLLKKMARHGLR